MPAKEGTCWQGPPGCILPVTDNAINVAPRLPCAKRRPGDKGSHDGIVLPELVHVGCRLQYRDILLVGLSKTSDPPPRNKVLCNCNNQGTCFFAFNPLFNLCRLLNINT